MSSGRLNIRFTGESTRLNAQIRRLQGQVDRLQSKLKQVGQESGRSNREQVSGLERWARGIGAATIAYQGLNRLMSLGNELLAERLELQRGNLNVAAGIGDAQARLRSNLGAVGTYEEQERRFQEMRKFVEATASAANMRPEAVYAMAASAASAVGGDPRVVKEAVRAAAPHARFWPAPETLSVLVADLVDMGFTGQKAMRHIVEMQRQVHTTELPKLEYAMRAMMSGEMFSQGELTEQQRVRVVEEMSAIYAAMTRSLREKGGQISGTSAAGAIASIYRRFGRQLTSEYGEFVSPFQALDWVKEAGVVGALKWEDFLGEAVARKHVMDMVRGGRAQETARKIYAESFEAPDMKSFEGYVRGITEAATAEINASLLKGGLEAAKTKRAAAFAGGAGALEVMEAYREEVGAGTAGMLPRVSEWLSGRERHLFGMPKTPLEFRMRFFRQLARTAAAEKYPWLQFYPQEVAGGFLDPQLRPTEMERRYREGLPPLGGEYFDPQARAGRMAVIEEAMEHSRRWEDYRARKQAEDSALNTRSNGNASGNDAKTQRRIEAAKIQQNGATLQNGRQTEPD